MSHGVKVVHSGGVCRRFVVDDFQELKRGIRDLAGVDPCSVTLCYVDSDGDVVEMETATEFVAAVAQAGTRPLTIRLSARPLRPTPVPTAPLCAGADAGAASAALHLSVAAGAADTVHVVRAPRSTPYVPGSGGAATTATATIDAFVPRRRTTGHRDPCAAAVVAPSLRVEVLAECLATADKASSPHGDLVLQVVLRAGSEAGLLRASCAVREGGGDAARVSSLRLAVSVEEAASSGPSAAGGEDGGSTMTRVTCDDEDEDEDSNSSSVSGSSSSASSASLPARQRLTRRVLRRHRRAAARPAAAAVAAAAADGNDDNERNKEKKTKKKKGVRERRVADGGTRTSTSGGDDGSGTLTSSSSSSSLTTSVDESSTDASTYSTSSPSGTTSGSQTSLTTAASSATQQRRDRRRGGGSRRNRHREPEAAAAAAAAGSLPLAVPLASVELVMGQVVEGPYNMRGIALQGGSPRLGVPVSV